MEYNWSFIFEVSLEVAQVSSAVWLFGVVVCQGVKIRNLQNDLDEKEDKLNIR